MRAILNSTFNEFDGVHGNWNPNVVLHFPIYPTRDGIKRGPRPAQGKREIDDIRGNIFALKKRWTRSEDLNVGFFTPPRRFFNVRGVYLQFECAIAIALLEIRPIPSSLASLLPISRYPSPLAPCRPPTYHPFEITALFPRVNVSLRPPSIALR